MRSDGEISVKSCDRAAGGPVRAAGKRNVGGASGKADVAGDVDAMMIHVFSISNLGL